MIDWPLFLTIFALAPFIAVFQVLVLAGVVMVLNLIFVLLGDR